MLYKDIILYKNQESSDANECEQSSAARRTRERVLSHGGTCKAGMKVYNIRRINYAEKMVA